MNAQEVLATHIVGEKRGSSSIDIPDAESRALRNVSAQSNSYTRQISASGSGRPSLGPPQSTRGISIVPRRISGFNRGNSGELGALRKIYAASRPIGEIRDEMQVIVEEVFRFVPRQIREWCASQEYRKVEHLLLRRAKQVVLRARKLEGAREEGYDDTSGIFFNNSDVEFGEWLAEFLFTLWYACIPPEQEESISAIRQACKQIVWRTLGGRRQVEYRERWYHGMLRMCPWRFRLMLGEKGPSGETSWSELCYDPFDRDCMSRRFASSSSAALHWFTLEFPDPTHEKSFQVDLAYGMIRSPFWQFCLTLVLALTYIVVQFGLLRADYPSVTLARLILTEPVSWTVVSAIFQLAAHAVVINDSATYRDNFFLFQFFFAFCVILAAAVWMYQVRSLFHFAIWPLNEGFTMGYILVCVCCLFYVRFVYAVWLTVFSAGVTVALRFLLLEEHPISETFPLQQGLALSATITLVLAGRYFFESHSRKDFVMTKTLFNESERSDRLLRSILPDQVIQHLKDSEQLASAAKERDSVIGIAEAYDLVTILFVDVCGFTSYSSQISPEELVLFLNELFTCFDDMAEQFGLEKIKTIGDAYMAVGGLNHSPDSTHSVAAARMGLQITQLMQSGRFKDHEGVALGARVGIHSGSCVAGVIGRKKFIYDIWGDAVNTASRMESTGEVNSVHCSESTADLLAKHGLFELQDRGLIEVKGKGHMRTFFVRSEVRPTEDDSPRIQTILEELHSNSSITTC